ncbi:MAG TPA: GMC family oxidoreductase [Solibacterales bacterium]|nr:GMC family oxidoreductase [Bryobacterales bacterium]
MENKVYDAVVVGSGAGGATAAWVLANAGLQVLILEAGRTLRPAKDFLTHSLPYHLPFRGAGKPGEYDGLWKINEYTAHLYTNPRRDGYDSLDGFHWTRLRAVGGRTNTWGRSCFRHGPLDFETWPVSYAEMAPYYDKVERLVGISGQADNYVNMPDGIYAGPPHRPRCGELFLRDRAARIGVPVLLERTAALSVPYDGRPACHYCGACGHGCDVRARFSTLDVMVPRLARKPNFTLRTNAVAHLVTMDREGRASGVAFFDAISKKSYDVKARAVVLAASTVESGRILLNSKIANSSGLLGRYLMDTIKSGPVVGVVPLLRNRKRQDEEGAGGSHVTIPRFNYQHKVDYQGGYFLLTGTGFGRGMSSAGGLETKWGAALKDEIRSRYGATISLRGYGECLPYHSNQFEIDPERKDAYGIPQVRFRCGHGANERRMMEDMYGWMERVLKACDAEILPYRKYLEPLGDATHECGTARMGTDPRTSVLNPYCQSHDVKNLFVTDASCFVSSPGTHGITTWIMALAWRASEYLADRMKRSELA